MKAFCPYCGSIFPAGTKCACRPKRKRAQTERDLHRSDTEPWRQNYDDPVYRRNRQTVISVQQGRCNRCHRLCAHHNGKRWITAGYGGEVHHKVPLCDGGTNEIANLELVCKVCHTIIDNERRRS